MRTVTIATGKLAYPTICSFAEQIMSVFPKLRIDVYSIRNDYFGETITVSGLVTGQDLINQLMEQKKTKIDFGDVLLIPSNMLRMGEQVFLDDITVQDVEKELDIKVVATESGGKEFIEAIINKDYCMNRDNDNFVYIKAYEDE